MSLRKKIVHKWIQIWKAGKRTLIILMFKSIKKILRGGTPDNILITIKFDNYQSIYSIVKNYRIKLNLLFWTLNLLWCAFGWLKKHMKV